MGRFTKGVRDIVGVASELLIMKDPYQRYQAPEILHEETDRFGNVQSQLVRAHSAQDSTQHLQGTVIQGDRSIVSTHLIDVQRGLYDVHSERWGNMRGEAKDRVAEYDPSKWSETGYGR